MLRIAHIDTEATWRGGQQQVFSLIQGLQNQGIYNLAVVKKNSSLKTRLLQNGIPVFEVRPWGEWDILEGLRIKRFLKQNHIDLIHAHSAHGAAFAVMVHFFSSIPYVITRRVDFHLSRNPFTQMKYRLAHHVIAISNKVRSILIENGIPEKKISLVPSGVDFRRYENVRPIPKSELGLSPDDIVVGQVAALAPHKDQATFLRALAFLIKNHPKVVGILVGDGELRPSLERLASDLGIQHRVIFTGFKDNSLDYLKSFDVFCMSSKEEGLGTSILDAMALGIPVVATSAGGIPDIVRDEETGFLVPPQDPSALASVLEKIVSLDHRALEKLVSKATELVRKFDIQSTVVGTSSVYKKIIRE